MGDVAKRVTLKSNGWNRAATMNQNLTVFLKLSMCTGEKSNHAGRMSLSARLIIMANMIKLTNAVKQVANLSFRLNNNQRIIKSALLA